MVYLVVAEVVCLQTFNLFSLWSGIAIDNTLVSFVSYFFTDVVLVICYKDALAVSSVLCIQLHCGMKGCARACEEIEDSRTFFGTYRYKVF